MIIVRCPSPLPQKGAQKRKTAVFRLKSHHTVLFTDPVSNYDEFSIVSINLSLHYNSSLIQR